MSAVWIFGGSNPAHEDAVNGILAERRRKDQLKTEGRFKFTCADQGMGNMERLACVMEEVGEVAAEELTLRRLTRDRDRGRKSFEDPVELRKEVTQVAALCLAWLESPCNSLPRMGA
jgi:hypothetical protein